MSNSEEQKEIEELKKKIEYRDEENSRLRASLDDVHKVYAQRRKSFTRKIRHVEISPFLWKYMFKVRRWFPKFFKFYDAFMSARRAQNRNKILSNNNEVRSNHPELSPLVVFWHNDNGMNLGEFVEKSPTTWKGVEVAALNEAYEEGLLDIDKRSEVNLSLKNGKKS